MTSQFDMNSSPAMCKICSSIHGRTPCKYDDLFRTVLARNKQLGSQQQTMVQMYNRLREFQALIMQMTPMLERLTKIEEKYMELTGGENGTKDVQTETPEQLTLQGI